MTLLKSRPLATALVLAVTVSGGMLDTGPAPSSSRTVRATAFHPGASELQRAHERTVGKGGRAVGRSLRLTAGRPVLVDSRGAP
jgi:hypothetical protein